MVSVVMPALRFSPEMTESIQSVLAQTQYLSELIVVDDSGKGEVKKAIEQELGSLPKLKVLVNERNQGSGPSRNNGVRAAQGSFIAFCDADDLWLPNKLQKQIDFMLANKVFFCFTSYSGFDHESGKDRYTVHCKKELGLWDFVKDTRIGTSSVVIDAQVLKDKIFFPPIRTSQDTVCWINILKTGVKAVPLNEVLVRYREGNQKATFNKGSAAKDYYNVLRVTLQTSHLRTAYCFAQYAFNAVLKRLAK